MRGRRTLATFLFSLALGASILVVFLVGVGLSNIAETVSAVPPTTIVSIFLVNLVALMFYGLSWYVILRSAGCKLGFVSCQGISLMGVFLYYVTPSGILLEAARVILAAREGKIGLGVAAATVVIHRTLFTFGFIASSLISIAMLTLHYQLPGWLMPKLLLLTGIVLVSLLAFIYFAMNFSRFEGVTRRIVRRMDKPISRLIGAGSINVRLDELTQDFEETLRTTVKKLPSLLLSFGLVMSYWGLSVTIMYLVFLGLRYDTSIWIIVLTMTLGEFIQMTPVIVPGMVGVFEASLTTIFGAFGVPVHIAASATILARIATFWFSLPLSALAAFYFGSRYGLLAILKSLFATQPHSETR